MLCKTFLSLFSLVLLLVAPDSRDDAPNEHSLPQEWTDIFGDKVDLREFSLPGKDVPLLFIRATDCFPCIEDEIKLMCEMNHNAFIILGYLSEAELEPFRNTFQDKRVLLDPKYETIRALRIRHTPARFLLTFDLKVRPDADMPSKE